MLSTVHPQCGRRGQSLNGTGAPGHREGLGLSEALPAVHVRSAVPAMSPVGVPKLPGPEPQEGRVCDLLSQPTQPCPGVRGTF